MLRGRRGAVLLLVLGVATALLVLAAWGAMRLTWMWHAVRISWDRVAVDFAAVEVEHAARQAAVPAAGEPVATGTRLTANRLVGRWEVTAVATGVWRVRWGVGGADGLWREGTWLGIPGTTESDGLGRPIVRPLPGLPPDR